MKQHHPPLCGEPAVLPSEAQLEQITGRKYTWTSLGCLSVTSRLRRVSGPLGPGETERVPFSGPGSASCWSRCSVLPALRSVHRLLPTISFQRCPDAASSPQNPGEWGGDATFLTSLSGSLLPLTNPLPVPRRC